jgi:hypothetical protein
MRLFRQLHTPAGETPTFQGFLALGRARGRILILFQFFARAGHGIEVSFCPLLGIYLLALRIAIFFIKNSPVQSKQSGVSPRGF